MRSTTRWYRALYTMLAPTLPLLRRLFPDDIATSAEVGRAMIEAALWGLAPAIVESRGIAALARRGAHD